MEKKDRCLISDTDSLYLEIKDILNHIKDNGIDILEDEIDDYILKIASKIEEEANSNNINVCYDFNLKENKYFKLKQEVIVRRLIIQAKRRYAMWITNKEGVSIPVDHEDALDLKGLELMKSNSSKLFKDFGENMIKNILFGESKDSIDSSIISFYTSLKDNNLRTLGKPTGVRYITEYIKRSATSGEIFSELKTGAPFNTKGAVRFNDLLKFKRLDKKFESIVEGDKIFVINLKPNPYHIETIGIPNAKIPEEIENFIKEFIDVEEIFNSALLNKLKSLYEDLGWESFPNYKNKRINHFFKF